MFSFIQGETSKWAMPCRILVYAEIHGILKNLSDKMVDSKIYFNFSICQRTTKKQKTKLYS